MRENCDWSSVDMLHHGFNNVILMEKDVPITEALKLAESKFHKNNDFWEIKCKPVFLLKVLELQTKTDY